MSVLLALQCFFVYVCVFNKSFLVFFIAFLYFLHSFFNHDTMCTIKMNSACVIFFLLCVCEKGAWLVHFRRLNQNKKKINGNKHMFKRKATSKPWFRYITRLFCLLA